MTLEDLRQEFARLQKKRLGPRFSPHSACDRVIEDWASDNDVDVTQEDAKLCDRLWMAANQYIIARDEGLPAAVMWKLSKTG